MEGQEFDSWSGQSHFFPKICKKGGKIQIVLITSLEREVAYQIDNFFWPLYRKNSLNWLIWSYVGKWGGTYRGVLPLSNHCLPHFLIFKLEPPSSKLLNPLVEKFLTPKLKNFWFCKKGPNPLVEFWWLPPSRFSELEPPTSKILDLLPEEKNSANKGQNPLVEKNFFAKKVPTP